jgi:hypothetical protein
MFSTLRKDGVEIQYCELHSEYAGAGFEIGDGGE